MKNIRNYVFWSFDYLKGSPIRKHIKEIREIYYNKQNTAKLQQKLLNNLLNYAVTHTTYYKKYTPGLLNSFPVINKSDILVNMDNLFSVEYKDKKETLKIMTTSGSSGTPFRIYLNKDKIDRNKADLLFFYKFGNYNVGDRMYYLRIWNKFNRKSKKELFLENFRMLDSSNVDSEGAQGFLNTMTNDKNQKVILGYGSSFTALMECLPIDKKINWKIKAIFSGSEELPNQIKTRMQQVFNCPIMSRYSNQENGILAQQPPTGENYFELNISSYYIEFLKIDSDEPAEENEEARIVVTDLFNKAVPMIRYDTGDLGVYNYIEDKVRGKRRVLVNISGRKADFLYSNQKKRLSPYTVINLMWKYTDIKQFQLIQEDYEVILLKIVYRNEDKKKMIEAQLDIEIKQIFGSATKLIIQNLENIPIEQSGKRKYIISKIDL